MSKQDTDQPSGKDKDKEKDGENASPIADDWDVDFGANSFGELTTEKRILLAFVIFIKLCLVVGALYFFICALSFMATGFRLVSCSSSSVAWVGVVPAAVVVPVGLLDLEEDLLGVDQLRDPPFDVEPDVLGLQVAIGFVTISKHPFPFRFKFHCGFAIIFYT